MSDNKPTAESFLRDVAAHVMTVKMDNGIYRHIRFRKPMDSNMWFDIVTWPGVLTIHGDMGTWTFSRVENMFTLFRDDKLRVNKDYWAEKLQHGTHGGRDGAKVWNEDLFKERIVAQLTEYYDLKGKDLAAVTQALKDEVLCQDNKYDLLIAARDFSCRLPSMEHLRENDRHGNFHFDTTELPDGKEYAYHFVWCIYAIVWAIQKYDANSVRPVEVAGCTTNA
jgi:hypothetical protein